MEEGGGVARLTLTPDSVCKYIPAVYIAAVDPLALYGAIIGTIAALAAGGQTITKVFEMSRDRAVVELRPTMNYRLSKPGSIYFGITVVSKGRHSVRVTGMGVGLDKKMSRNKWRFWTRPKSPWNLPCINGHEGSAVILPAVLDSVSNEVTGFMELDAIRRNVREPNVGRPNRVVAFTSVGIREAKLPKVMIELMLQEPDGRREANSR